VTPKLYKAGEVCEATGLQPYVLRSWEKEFPGIGVQKSPETPRLYRQSDVEQVLRIKQLVFGEGLTLAWARRRIEETSPRAASAARDAEIAEVLDTLGADARDRIALVRSGLKSILDVLSSAPGTTELAPMQIGAAPGRNGAGRSSGSRPTRAAASKRRAGARKTTKSKRRRAGA
jgi:DNA-binding transcriptional MerR regulator